MKILYLSNSRIPSITANSIHVFKMSEAFKKNGSTLRLIGIKPSLFYSEIINYKDRYGIINNIDFKTFIQLRGFKGYDYLFKVKKECKKYNPDIVYTRSIGIAYHISKMGYDIIYEAHGPLYSSEENIFKDFLNSKHFKFMVVISDVLKNIFENKYGENLKNKMLVEHDAVDIDRFKDYNSKSSKFCRKKINLIDKYTILYSGHLYKGRGIEVIIKIAKRMPEINFLIVGGNKNDINNNKTIINKSDVKNIIFTGFIDNRYLPNYICSADLLLMPYQEELAVSGGGKSTSKWMSPMKMFEYMASKRPIISSNLPVLKEVLSDKYCTFCDPKDIDSWVFAIKKYLNDYELSIKHAQLAYKHVQKFTWDLRAKRILANLKNEN